MFFEGQDIGHDLAGVGPVGKPVDHGHVRILGHFGQNGFVKGPDHDHIHIARQNAGGVGDGFAMAQLHVLP